MKYLIVKPVGGLANRMRVLESAYNCSKEHNGNLIVIWERNSSLNAKYSDCFRSIDGVRVIEAEYNNNSIFAKFKGKIFDSIKDIGVAFFTQKKLYDADISPYLVNDQPLDEAKTFFGKLAKQNKGLYIETCYEWYPNISAFRLNIQETIRKKAAASLQNHPTVIGIHIRRTDNADSINNSPLEKFIEEINSNLKSFPSSAFYLSTDSDEVVQQLRYIFKEKIITGVSVRTRDSKEGITSALIDLYCLSQCKIILGSFKSSFSERAAIIGNIPLQIVAV